MQQTAKLFHGNVAIPAERVAGLLQSRLILHLRPLDVRSRISRLQQRCRHAAGHGCECGPCQGTCNGSACGATITIQLGPGKECDALAPPACEKCAGSLTCGPDKDVLNFHVCCAPHGTSCASANDCCKTGPGNAPPPGKQVSCAGRSCSFCSQNIGDSCTFDADCCSPLMCIDNQCRSCVPLLYLPCDKPQCAQTKCPAAAPFSPSETGCCDWDDLPMPESCPPDDVFKPCCPNDLQQGRDIGGHCGGLSWCCTT